MSNLVADPINSSIAIIGTQSSEKLSPPGSLSTLRSVSIDAKLYHNGVDEHVRDTCTFAASS
jgi:hypothetical protein